MKKFVHVDPIENLVDEPLVYEKCWFLPHSRVVAIGRYECLDVTKKYTTLTPGETMNILMRKSLTDLLNLRNQMWVSDISSNALTILKEQQLNDDHNFKARHNTPSPSQIHPYRSLFQ